MKKHLLKAAAILTIATLVNTQDVSAQGNTVDFLKTGKEDANALINAYASPLLKSFGAGLNGGWFNTAKPHGLGGFDITFAGNITFAPTADQSYNVGTLGLKSVKLMPGSGGTAAPTVFGSNSSADTVGLFARYPGSTMDSLLTRLPLPPGIGLNIFALPTLQVAVGVGFGTEVAIRYFPSMNFGGVNVGMFGFAVKHDFKQWIPGMKKMPFDLSAMFGYTSFDASYKFDNLQAEKSSTTTYNANPNKVYSNQQIEFGSSAWTLNVLISKKLAIFTPYLGLGYQYANTTLKMAGDYPIIDVNPNFDYTKSYIPGPTPNPFYSPTDPNSHPKIVREFSDPISLSGKISGMRATMGFRLHLAIMTIHADYTFAEYNVASVGVGLNLQSIRPFHLM